VRRTLKPTEAPAETYDRQFANSEEADRHYSLSIQHRLYRRVCHELEALPSQSILEVGCGAGAFAHCLMDTLSREYRGFDFSEVAVRMACARTRHEDCFFVADARHSISYEQPYDTIVCLEVLEHIERDLDVIANWHPGCHSICSVPNFDYPTHVRWFRHEAEIVSRYGHLISIRKIERIPCPLIRGRGWRAYLRQLRWSRDDPRRLMGLLGYRRFDNFAGWFLFCGTRR
jgi:2-polyprenyl-3-methyl-5-hydroxy-6-metoxy-1,4-benzoquinol methylase